MCVDRKLLEILVCPVTKQPVSMLSLAKLDLLNRKISAGEVSNHGGTVVSSPLAEALITENGTTIYPVADGIPVMLEDESIDTGLLQDF